MLLPTFTGSIVDPSTGQAIQGQLRVFLGSNLANIFADPDLTVPLPNPVQLNSLGQAPGIYTTPGTFTVQVLRDGAVWEEATYTPGVEVVVFQGQQLNGSGLPNAGGHVFTYMDDSFSVLTPTFKDTALTEVNENPSRLSNTGHVQTRFFTQPGRKVNFVLTDAGGTVLSSVQAP